MPNFEDMDDIELFYSVGSFRPERVGLGGILYDFDRWDDQRLKAGQDQFDAAVAEMRKRHKERGFPFMIPG